MRDCLSERPVLSQDGWAFVWSLIWAAVEVDLGGGDIWRLSADYTHSWAAVPSMKKKLGVASLCLLQPEGLCVGSPFLEETF